MIKVLLNGTPIYKLCFSRRIYKTVGRKRLTLGEVLKAIGEPGNIAIDQAKSIIRKAFGGKPLYETTAIVYMVDAKQGEPPVATASTRQSKLDDNRRSTGREVALGRLLRDNNNPPFSEVERVAIREAYKNRFPKTTKKTPPTPSAGSAPVAQARPPRVEARSKPTHSVISKILPGRWPAHNDDGALQLGTRLTA